jgi:hypothetical protein
MTSKPNWSCNKCGMYSSRRSSVKRHIITQHGGNGIPIPFADYVAGIRNGFYPGAERPLFTSTKSSNVQEDELEKEITKRAVHKLLDTMPDVVDSYIPSLLTSLKFESGSISKVYFGKANAKSSDEIFGLVRSSCQKCGLSFKTDIKYGDDIQTLGLSHHICEEQPSYVQSVTGSSFINKDDPRLLFLSKIKFKGQILEWTFNNCALLMINIGNLSDDTIVSMGDNPTMFVKLNSKTESIVTLNELDLSNYDWLTRGIDKGWATMEKEELDQYLNIVPNKTWFYLRLLQPGNEHYYFVMLFFPYVKKRPVCLHQQVF